MKFILSKNHEVRNGSIMHRMNGSMTMHIGSDNIAKKLLNLYDSAPELLDALNSINIALDGHAIEKDQELAFEKMRIILEKKYKNQDGGKSIINIGFYSSIENCLIKIIKEKANPKKTITLKEYVQRIEAIKNDVFKAFEIKPKVKIKKK